VGPRRDPAAVKKLTTAGRAYPSPTTPASAAGAGTVTSPTAGRVPPPMTSETAEVAPEAVQVHKPGKSRLTLERVLGVTALSNAMMSVNPVSGEIAYAAGCIVVIYNLRRNKQVRYYRVDKSVSCLCFSPNGQYLAIGEKGYMPAITIWDGSNGALCAELQLHKFGVACMAFSRDGELLLSAGLIHDQYIYAWKLARDGATGRMRSKAVGVAQIQDKILGVDFCQEGNFFVTVGENHFKVQPACRLSGGNSFAQLVCGCA
jgi:WD40 repeat protein